jgi:hypothetical protein
MGAVATPPIGKPGADAPDFGPADAVSLCPPEWILRLAALRTDDDALVLNHVTRCARCADAFARTLDSLRKVH